MRAKFHLDELERKLYETYQKLEIPSYETMIIGARLLNLRKHHRPTWEHSIRVALYSMDVADIIIKGKISPLFTDLKNNVVPNVAAPKPLDYTTLFYPAISHDFGKTSIPVTLLEKKVGWNKQDSLDMEKHTAIGAELANADSFEFSSYVIKNVHSFDRKHIKPLVINPTFSKRTNLLMLETASILNIIDYYDAASYRLDDRNSPGVSRYLEPEEVCNSLLKDRADERNFIIGLYNLNIF
jgi:hypothetical protein